MAKHQRSTVRDARKPGWFYIDNAIIDRCGAEVGAIGVAVYVALARFANRDGQSFPAYRTLESNLKLARNTVIAAIRRLESAGLITVEQQTDRNGNPIATNIYTLCALADWHHESMAGGVQQMNGGGSIDAPPRAADERGGSIDAPRGSSAAYEHDSSNMHVGGDRARAKKTTANGTTPRHVAYLIDQNMVTAAEFADLDPDAAIADFDARRADGQSIAIIVTAWRVKAPESGAIYAKQQSQPRSDSASRAARRSAVGTYDADRDRAALAELQRQTVERLARERGG